MKTNIAVTIIIVTAIFCFVIGYRIGSRSDQAAKSRAITTKSASPGYGTPAPAAKSASPGYGTPAPAANSASPGYGTSAPGYGR